MHIQEIHKEKIEDIKKNRIRIAVPHTGRKLLHFKRGETKRKKIQSKERGSSHILYQYRHCQEKLAFKNDKLKKNGNTQKYRRTKKTSAIHQHNAAERRKQSKTP